MTAFIVTGLNSTETVQVAQLVADEPLGDDVMSKIIGPRVVALLRVPLPMNQSLVDACTALQTLYGAKLNLEPFGREDEFCRVVIIEADS